jgi:hypothetical protein
MIQPLAVGVLWISAGTVQASALFGPPSVLRMAGLMGL